MNKAQLIASTYANKTDLKHELSYQKGGKNIIDARKSTDNIRLKVTNGTTEDRIIYVMPSEILGIQINASTSMTQINALLTQLGLPSGIPFVKGVFGEAADKEVTIASMNRDQHLNLLAGEMSTTPIQINGISLSSFNATTGVPESSNNGNTVTHYNVSSLRPKRYTDLPLSSFQSTKDNATNILKVDFLKQAFTCSVSQSDIFAFTVNKNTQLEITLHIGARDSRAEYFHRQITGGIELLHDQFADEVAEGCNC